MALQYLNRVRIILTLLFTWQNVEHVPRNPHTTVGACYRLSSAKEEFQPLWFNVRRPPDRFKCLRILFEYLDLL